LALATQNAANLRKTFKIKNSTPLQNFYTSARSMLQHLSFVRFRFTVVRGSECCQTTCWMASSCQRKAMGHL